MWLIGWQLTKLVPMQLHTLLLFLEDHGWDHGRWLVAEPRMPSADWLSAWQPCGSPKWRRILTTYRPAVIRITQQISTLLTMTTLMILGEVAKVFARLMTYCHGMDSQWKCLDQRRDPGIVIAKPKQYRHVYKHESGDRTQLMHL